MVDVIINLLYCHQFSVIFSLPVNYSLRGYSFGKSDVPSLVSEVFRRLLKFLKIFRNRRKFLRVDKSFQKSSEDFGIVFESIWKSPVHLKS